MSSTLRYADKTTISAYPLTCHGQAEWHRHDNSLRTTLQLGAIDGGSIVVPSLAVLDGQNYQFQFALTIGAKRWQLNAVPAESAAEASPGQPVTTHIDCYHVHQQVAEARLEVEVWGLPQITRYLLSCSMRPLNLDRVEPPSFTATCSPPPAISQLSDAEIGPRICSPTSVAMVLATNGTPVELADISADCFDPVTSLYGSWPMAIRAASRRGALGAVEVFETWQEVEPALSAGSPFVASIRFGPDQLPGAPLQNSGGHLVVVYGCSPRHVWVNDPAAPTANTVPRVYDAAAFSRAWLAHRGAAYILMA